MKTISEPDFIRLCIDMCADRDFTWQRNPDLTREDALWWDTFRRVCWHFGRLPLLIGNTGDRPYREVCRSNILRVVKQSWEGDFDPLRIASRYVREALRQSAKSAQAG